MPYQIEMLVVVVVVVVAGVFQTPVPYVWVKHPKCNFRVWKRPLFDVSPFQQKAWWLCIPETDAMDYWLMWYYKPSSTTIVQLVYIRWNQSKIAIHSPDVSGKNNIVSFHPNRLPTLLKFLDSATLTSYFGTIMPVIECWKIHGTNENCNMRVCTSNLVGSYTQMHPFLGTNIISPTKALLKMIFPFPLGGYVSFTEGSTRWISDPFSPSGAETRRRLANWRRRHATQRGRYVLRFHPKMLRKNH